jgi:hypothetical protein
MTLSAEDGLEETMLIDTLYGEPIVLPDNSIQQDIRRFILRKPEIITVGKRDFIKGYRISTQLDIEGSNFPAIYVPFEKVVAMATLNQKDIGQLRQGAALKAALGAETP